MSDFQWTDELVKEFAVAKWGAFSLVEKSMEQFKEEHTKPKVEWEIVKFISKKGDFWWDAIGKDTFRGCAYNSEFHVNSLLGNPPDARASVANGEILIHSVRRLSDNLVFTIGDEDEKYGKIDSFYIQSDKWMLAKCGNNRVFIEDLKRVTKPIPLFKSDEGQDVFDGEQLVYYISEYRIRDRKAKNMAGMSNRRFISREAAENYILHNKPCLSLDDVYKLADLYDYSMIKADAKNLAKEKLSK